MYLDDFKKAIDVQGKYLNNDINRQKAQSYGDSTFNKIVGVLANKFSEHLKT